MPCRDSEEVQNVTSKWLFYYLPLESWKLLESTMIIVAAVVTENLICTVLLSIIFPHNIWNAAPHKLQADIRLCWRNVPSAWGGLSAERISPAWSWCAEIPLPTIWTYPVPLSRCWRTGQSQATFPRWEQDQCGHTTANKIRKRERNKGHTC